MGPLFTQNMGLGDKKKECHQWRPLPLPQKVALLFLSLFFYHSFPFSMGLTTKNATIAGAIEGKTISQLELHLKLASNISYVNLLNIDHT